MSMAEALLEWAGDEAHQGSLGHQAKVAQILAVLRNGGVVDPESLPVGSPQRFLAQRRIDRLVERAEFLGFETPGRAIKKEIGKQIAGRALGIEL
ncbi:hypothetical protein [Acidithiobacillus sulfuriphilus]|uniref:hypothetical protein n=1 Tax=Acidithiobacillus sulfuriphilus TaxID=1867749 RepID=UPI003F619B9B